MNLKSYPANLHNCYHFRSLQKLGRGELDRKNYQTTHKNHWAAKESQDQVVLPQYSNIFYLSRLSSHFLSGADARTAIQLVGLIVRLQCFWILFLSAFTLKDIVWYYWSSVEKVTLAPKTWTQDAGTITQLNILQTFFLNKHPNIPNRTGVMKVWNLNFYKQSFARKQASKSFNLPRIKFKLYWFRIKISALY